MRCTPSFPRVCSSLALQHLNFYTFCLLSFQELPPLDQLQQQFSDKVHQEPNHCLSKDGSVKNVVPDPDVPPNCDTDSSEYGYIQWIVEFMNHFIFFISFTLISSFG